MIGATATVSMRATPFQVPVSGQTCGDCFRDFVRFRANGNSEACIHAWQVIDPASDITQDSLPCQPRERLVYGIARPQVEEIVRHKDIALFVRVQPPLNLFRECLRFPHRGDCTTARVRKNSFF